MNCKEVDEQDVLERYLLERLTEQERDEFEKHYFECGPCFVQLQTALTLQEELRSKPLVAIPAGRPLFRRAWAWAPALVVVVLLFAVGIWWYKAEIYQSWRQASSSASSNSSGTPAAGALISGDQSQTSSPATPTLEQLARVKAPSYSGIILRGAENEAQETFRKAMLSYTRGDYAKAIPGLQAATKASSETAKFSFYLGACYLLTGQTDDAIESFRRTIALDDAAYSEPAHFYLAKAYLAKKVVPAAEEELQTTVQLRGSKAAEAAEILRQLRK
jgi:tetratricopeptide (TPR) repeat protein